MRTVSAAHRTGVKHAAIEIGDAACRLRECDGLLQLMVIDDTAFHAIAGHYVPRRLW
jgi:hypothetical protein